jgi:hypothetical protein
MRMPGFTAEMGIGASTTHYSAASAHGAAGFSGQLRPALVASQCKTSSCMKLGRCTTRVRCCRNFNGSCSCQTVPCFIFADSA